jgi:hypothetical protein
MHSSILCIRPFLRSDHHFGRAKEGLPRSRSYGTIHFIRKKAIQDGFCTIFSCLLLCDRARLSIRVCLAEPRRLFKASSITAVDWSMQPTRTPNTLHLPLAFLSELPLFPENMSVRWAQLHFFFLSKRSSLVCFY